MGKDNILEDLLSEFSSYLRETKAKAESTLKVYLADIKKIAQTDDYNSYRELVEIIDKRVRTLDTWDKKSKLNTRARRVAAINSFFEFFKKTQKAKKLLHYHHKQAKRKLIMTLSEQEFSKIISLIPSNNYRDARDRAIFTLAYFSGVTESEVANLEYKNFEFGESLYLNVGRGYKERRLKLPEEAAKEIKNYGALYSTYAELKELPLLQENTFFKNKFGEQISERSIRRKFEKSAKKVVEGAKLKHLRYSYAKTMHNKGKTTKELAGLLGILPLSARITLKFLTKN